MRKKLQQRRQRRLVAKPDVRNGCSVKTDQLLLVAGSSLRLLRKRLQMSDTLWEHRREPLTALQRQTLFTLERKNFPNADFPLEGSGSFTAAFGSSLVVVFTGLADASPLASIFGGSGGGGGGTDMPLGAAGGSDTCATYTREMRQHGCPDSFNTFKFNMVIT